MDPFELLVTLEEKCRSVAEKLSIPQNKESQDILWHGIGFRVVDTRYIIPLREIFEIVSLMTIVDVPKTAIWFKGIASLRSQLFTVSDLANFLVGAIEPETKLTRLMIVKEGQNLHGFIISELLGIQQYSENSHQWVPFSFKTLLQDPRYLKIIGL